MRDDSVNVDHAMFQVCSYFIRFSRTFETTRCLGCFWTGSSPSICWSQSWSWPVLERVCIFWSRVFRMPTSGAASHWGTSRWLKHTAEMTTTAMRCYDGTCVDVCAKSCIDATLSESIVFSLVICNQITEENCRNQYIIYNDYYLH